MARVIIRIVFVLSVGLNAAFILHLSQTAETPLNAELELSPLQQQHMKILNSENKIKKELIREKINQCHEQLLELIENSPPDRAGIDSCLDELSRLQKQLQSTTVDEIITLRELLDASQCRCLMKNLKSGLEQTSQPGSHANRIPGK